MHKKTNVEKGRKPRWSKKGVLGFSFWGNENVLLLAYDYILTMFP